MSKIPGKNTGGYRIREQQTKNANSDYRKKCHHTATRKGLDQKIQINNWKHPSTGQKPIGKATNNRKIPRSI